MKSSWSLWLRYINLHWGISVCLLNFPRGWNEMRLYQWNSVTIYFHFYLAFYSPWRRLVLPNRKKLPSCVENGPRPQLKQTKLWIFCHLDSLTAAVTVIDISLVGWGHVILEFGGEYARHLVRSDCQLEFTTRENNFRFLPCRDRRKKMVRMWNYFAMIVQDLYFDFCSVFI